MSTCTDHIYNRLWRSDHNNTLKQINGYEIDMLQTAISRIFLHLNLLVWCFDKWGINYFSPKKKNGCAHNNELVTASCDCKDC